MTKSTITPAETEQPAGEAACELCGRVEMQTRIALLCRPCHSQVHAVLDNSQLVLAYHTIDALKTHPELAKFAAWIANKPAGLKVSIRRAQSS